MDAMRNILHFSNVDIDEAQVAGIGVIPMPGGQHPRVRLFLDGGGVIDLYESREQARDIWLERESKEERYSRLVEENNALRSAFDSMAIAIGSISDARPKEDILQVVDIVRRRLESTREIVKG